MNVKQANNLDLPDLLQKLGYSPDAKKSAKGKLWYCSPFRVNEKDSSFQVRSGTDYNFVWHDFGSGEGTTVLDFVKLYTRNDSTKDALAFLRQHFPNHRPVIKKDSNQTSFSFSSQAPQATENFFSGNSDSNLQFIQALPLKSKTIFSYLKGRGISGKLAAKYLSVVKYRNKRKPGREFFGFGWQNIHGIWEVRSASDQTKFKSALGQTVITVLHGSEKSRAGEFTVIEGMTDFLSLCTYFNADSLKGTAIILNGLELFNEASAYIEKQKGTSIALFLDNDDAGREKTQAFIERFGEKATDYSHTFVPHKDLNEALVAKHPLNFNTPKL